MNPGEAPEGGPRRFAHEGKACEYSFTPEIDPPLKLAAALEHALAIELSDPPEKLWGEYREALGQLQHACANFIQEMGG